MLVRGHGGRAGRRVRSSRHYGPLMWLCGQGDVPSMRGGLRKLPGGGFGLCPERRRRQRAERSDSLVVVLRMNLFLISVVLVVLFAWPLSVFGWRRAHRPRPEPATDAYRAAPPAAPPAPPWFVRLWETTWVIRPRAKRISRWRRLYLWIRQPSSPFLSRGDDIYPPRGFWIGSWLFGIGMVAGFVFFQDAAPAKAGPAPAARATARDDFNCVWGWWVPKNPYYNGGALSVTSIGTPAEPSALVCGMKGGNIECFETWKCP